MSFCIPLISALSISYVKIINFVFSFFPITENILTFITLLISSFIIFLLIKFFQKPYGMFQGAAYVLLYLHIGIYILAILCENGVGGI